MTLCFYCVEGVRHRPEDGPPDQASVVFEGVHACGFHANVHWGNPKNPRPARAFELLSALADSSHLEASEGQAFRAEKLAVLA